MKGRSITLPRIREHTKPILLSPARFKVLACGRRWGKSITGMTAAIQGHGAASNPFRGLLQGADIGWFAPTYPMSALAWRDFKHALRDAWQDKSEESRRITMPGGGSIQVMSTDNPDSLRGPGWDGVILDEAALIVEEAWTEAIRPTLTDRLGWAIFLSTPKGYNWFERLYSEALGEHWERWQRPTSDNPYISQAELDQARVELEAQVYAQEYEADFLLSGNPRFDPAAMLEGVAMARPPLANLPPELQLPGLKVWKLPLPGQPYVMGSDPAEGLPNGDGSCTQVLYARTLEHVASLWGHWEPAYFAGLSVKLGQAYNNAFWGIERNNHGHTVIHVADKDYHYPRLYWHQEREETFSQLRSGSEPTKRLGFPTTVQTRGPLIDDLALAIERRALTSYDEDYWRECRSFVKDARGVAGASAGARDDRVLAMAIARRMAMQSGATSMRELVATGPVYYKWGG